MGPAQAIATGFARSLQFSGRATRTEYWWFLPAGLALPCAALWLLFLLAPEAGFAAGAATVLSALVPLMAVTRRRLADTGAGPVGFEIPTMALVGFLAAIWAIRTLTGWAFGLIDTADGPSGLVVAILWLLGMAVLIPTLLHQFLTGFVYGTTLFGQMITPSHPSPYGPNRLR